MISKTGAEHIIQHVKESTTNSSTSNLNASTTFTGTSDSTLGVAGIQVTLKTDVDCTVYVDQSPDGTNWDITDPYNYYASIGNFGTTVQAVGSYFRVRVTNISASNSTYFRLQSVLCPIVEVLPRSLDENGHLLTSVHVMQDEYGFHIENTPNGEMRTVTPVLLIGTAFEGTTVDPNFGTATITNSGTVTQASGTLIVNTATTANGTAKWISLRRARYVPGQSHVCRFQLQTNNTGSANNIRRWGVAYGTSLPTITDGAYFELNGTTFNIVTLKGSSATTVASGDFNGINGDSYTLDTNVHTYEIYYNNKKVHFTVDDEVLHTVTATSATWADTMQHHIYIESSNSGGSTTENSITCRAAGLRRLGALVNQPTSKYQSGTTAGVVCKYGSGCLHGIAISGVTNNSTITLYDNTAASGTVLWSSGAMAALTQPFHVPFNGIPFFTGLTLVIAAANSTVTLSYE